MTDSVSNQDELDPTEGDVPADDDVVEEEGVDVEETVVLDEDEAAADADARPALDDEALGDDDLDGVLDIDSVLDGEEALAALQEDYSGLNDRFLRLAAEFTNFRKRTDQERMDLWGRAQAEMLGRLVDVLDDLQRVAALDLDSATVEGIMEGIDLVERKFVRALDDAGAEVIDPVGQAFDPEKMEAMMRVPAESEEDDDTVSQVFQKGYTFKGHLVRAARVSVLKHG